MATKKKALPELRVGAPEYQALVDKARELVELRQQISGLSTKEADAKKAIAESAITIRAKEEAKNSNYVGLIRITDQDQTPIQVQFKLLNGAIALENGATLEAHFGSARPMLWEKDVAIQSITDPMALIADLQAQGKNPCDYLDFSVKKNLDRTLVDSPHVTKVEAYLPKEGFLATCNEVKHTFNDKAKEYLRLYLTEALKPAVDLGKK